MRVPLNQNGQSLVQVMVAAAIMGVIMMAMVSSQTMQSRENTALTEKLSSLDLQRSLTSAESNSASCSKLFDPANAVNPSDLTFDATSVTSAAPHIIPLKQIPGIGTAPPVLVQNSQPSSLSQNLFVPAGGIQVKVSSPTSATLVVGFDQTRLVRSIHNLELPLSLRSTGPLNATTAAGCQTGTSSGTSLFKVSDFNVMPMAVDMNAPDYHAVHYSVPIPTLPFDQLYAMMGVGIWDVTTCGSFGGPCVTLVSLTPVIGGTATICGSNSGTGSSGPYTNVLSESVTCIVRVPANTGASVTVFYDGRGGATPNMNPGTYNTSYANATTPVFSLIPLN